MDDLKAWQSPEKFEAIVAAGLLPADVCVLIWNPCDGYHLSRLTEFPAARIIAEFKEGFGTHWCLMPDGPDVAPGDWHPMNTLEEAYDIGADHRDSPLLWSPTGAHKLPWLRADPPWRFAEQGRRGIYTGWRWPPARPN